MRVVALTDDAGRLLEPLWLARAEGVHRQLRDKLAADYASQLSEIFAHGGRMAVVADGDAVLCVALWRLIVNTHDGRRLYVDDLVSDEACRSLGAGRMMLDWLAAKAGLLACNALTLDSGVQRARAHRFYFREGMHVSSFCFRKAVK